MKWLKYSLVSFLIIIILFVYLGAKCPWQKNRDDEEIIITGSSEISPWTAIATTGAPSARGWHTTIWTGTPAQGGTGEMIIWGGATNTAEYVYYALNTGAKYYPVTDTWIPITTTDAPSNRTGHTAVWTGSEMIIWGGSNITEWLNTGAKYYSITDTWISITTTGAPSSRTWHTAVWTGSPAQGGTGEMIIWGGYGIGAPNLNTGAKYNLISDTWTAITTTDAPLGRFRHTAIWTGREMIIWGGDDAQGPITLINTGAKYNPISDTWTAITTTGEPSPREWHTSIWTGIEMIIWGGLNDSLWYLNTGAKYNPISDTWTAMPTTNAPSARAGHTAIWTGTPAEGGTGEMIVWGGSGDFASSLNTGAKYNSISDTWSVITISGASSARRRHTAIWTDNEMIIWGGDNDDSILNTGGRYKP